MLGENGAGKTTLMNILFGHYQADEGVVEVDGRPLPGGSTDAAIKAGIGMVHQHFTLADNLTVLENITLGYGKPLVPAPGTRPVRNEKSLVSPRHSAWLSIPMRRRRLIVRGERQRVEILKALYRDSRDS